MLQDKLNKIGRMMYTNMFVFSSDDWKEPYQSTNIK
jgi:hypothetical protein